jgi:hypothetical protein
MLCNDEVRRTVVLYWLKTEQSAQVFVMVADTLGNVTLPPAQVQAKTEKRYAYGLQYSPELQIKSETDNAVLTMTARLALRPTFFADGPFYHRFAQHFSVCKTSRTPQYSETDWYAPLTSQANGIGEVFRPARLCGPIASRAMWTRIRRRS